MNDPHVVSLHYEVLVGKGHDFNRAPPLRHEDKEFVVSVDGETAVFEMRLHYATEQEAFAIVHPFVDAWNVASDLDVGLGAFKLEFRNAEIIDRSPSPGRIMIASAGKITIKGGDVQLHIGHGYFPPPPKRFRNLGRSACHVLAVSWVPGGTHPSYSYGLLPVDDPRTKRRSECR